jgi:hypothetical protein
MDSPTAEEIFEEELLREEIELMNAEIAELKRSITKQVPPIARSW